MFKRILTALALCLAVLTPVSVVTASPASANTCPGPIAALKQAVGHGRTFWNGRGISFTSRINYEYCANGSLPGLVKPTSIQWCWDWDGDAQPAIGFQGVRYNSYIQDNNEVVNPATFEVIDRVAPGRVSHCDTQNIGADKERWLEQSQNARWWARGTVMMDLSGDPTDTWTGDFSPCRDPGGPVAC